MWKEFRRFRNYSFAILFWILFKKLRINYQKYQAIVQQMTVYSKSKSKSNALWHVGDVILMFQRKISQVTTYTRNIYFLSFLKEPNYGTLMSACIYYSKHQIKILDNKTTFVSCGCKTSFLRLEETTASKWVGSYLGKCLGNYWSLIKVKELDNLRCYMTISFVT